MYVMIPIASVVADGLGVGVGGGAGVSCEQRVFRV